MYFGGAAPLGVFHGVTPSAVLQLLPVPSVRYERYHHALQTVPFFRYYHEILPWRQSQCHTDSDMGKPHSMAAHAGSKEASKQEEVESVKLDDSCTHPAQLLR